MNEKQADLAGPGIRDYDELERLLPPLKTSSSLCLPLFADAMQAIYQKTQIGIYVVYYDLA